MQTFLPYPSFAHSAAVLDRARLGKQRLECVQLLRALESGGGWSNHPAARMWRGYEEALRAYLWCVVQEWALRGYVNNVEVSKPEGDVPPPPWLGDEKFHASHRSNLLRKMPEHYGCLGWTESPDAEYVWPE